MSGIEENLRVVAGSELDEETEWDIEVARGIVAAAAEGRVYQCSPTGLVLLARRLLALLEESNTGSKPE